MPDSSAIWKRIGASMPAFGRDPAFRPEPGSAVRPSVGSTGTKNGNRGEWIRVKRNVKGGFFKMRMPADLDALYMPEFRLTGMNSGDGAQPPWTMRGPREHATDGAPLPDPVAGLAVDRARECWTGRPDRSRAPMDRWLPGGDAESGDAESGEDDGDGHGGTPA